MFSKTAFVKRVISDTGYAVRDFNARQKTMSSKTQSPAMEESRLPPQKSRCSGFRQSANALRPIVCHAGRNIYVFQTAFVKRVISDNGYAVWNRYARQGIILRERPLTDGSDRLAVYFGRDCDVPFASCVPGYRHAFAVDFIC